MKLDRRRREKSAQRQDRQAARSRTLDRGRRRHPAHRHHQDVACGALGDHRARPRRRRLRAGSPMAAPGRCMPRMMARELRIGKVIIPRAPGHFSAYGMLMADLRRDFVNTWFTPLAKASFEDMESLYQDMERRGRAGIAPPCPCRSAGHRRRARRRHALCRPGARRQRRIADRTVRDAGSRRHQKLLRCRARDALRLCLAGRAGRDRQPALRRGRPDEEAAASSR